MSHYHQIKEKLESIFNNQKFIVYLLKRKYKKYMKNKPTQEEIEDYCENLLNKFKKDPQYDLKQEFGTMLMRHIDSFTIEERKRYDELKELLKNSY